MLVNRGMGGGLNAPGFWLELADAGAGAVNTTPSLANGSPTPTFTRATSAWTKLSTGLWASVATGIARSSYIGLTTAVGAYGGYLAEGARTQLVTPTASIRDMTDASWVKVTMTTSQTATGIDGVINSATTITAAGANSTILKTLVAAATSRTNSCWVKRRTGTGTVLLLQGTATLDITALINSSTYTQVQLNDNELNVAYGLQINTSADALDVDFNQFEAGGFASTPIDNAGTRNADALTYAVSGNLNIGTDPGAFYGEITVANPTLYTARAYIFSYTDAGNGRLNLRGPDTPSVNTPLWVWGTGSGVITATGSALVANTTTKIAARYGQNGGAIAQSGALVNSSASASNVSGGGAPFGIGCDQSGGLQLFGMLKNIRIWRSQFADSQLVSITQ